MSTPLPSPSSSFPIDPGGPKAAKISDRDTLLSNRDLEMKLQSPSVPSSIPAAKVPSYAARFKSSLRNLRKISDPSFLEDGTPVMQAPESVLLKTSELWKDHVVAHFHGRRPSAAKIVTDLNPVWGKFGNITVRTVSDTCVLIYIPSVQTREWVLQVGYWQADRCAFSVYPWTADGNLAAQELLFAPTWVILKNVPPQLYSLDGISVVASGIGDPLHTEKSRLDPYHFGDTKVKVEIELSKTPPEVVEVRDTQGNAVRINVEYPSLPPKCINCRKYGHLINRCHKPIMKRPQAQKKEKQEQVISVVKPGKEVSLAEQIQEVSIEEKSKEEGIVQSEEELEGKKIRSRSRRRSRSRARARARALSSPPEVVGGLSVVDSPCSVLCSDQKKSEAEIVLVEEEILEEGEICESPGAQKEEAKGDKAVQSDVLNRGEESSVWFTKHSKNYRRALRQMEFWIASGEVGTPPKSAKYLSRGSPSGKMH